MKRRYLLVLPGLLGLLGALLAALGLGLPRWVSGAALCLTGAELVNASGPELLQFRGELSYGLLAGDRVKQCGLGGRPVRFRFFPDLVPVLPAGLHVGVLFFCGAAVLFCGLSSGFFFFNAFGRPYETLQGPRGLYLWTGLSCLSSLLVLVLFAVEVKVLRLTERVSNFGERFRFQTQSESWGVCFWFYLLVLGLQGLSALLLGGAGAQGPPREGAPGGGAGGGAADLLY